MRRLLPLAPVCAPPSPSAPFELRLAVHGALGPEGELLPRLAAQAELDVAETQFWTALPG